MDFVASCTTTNFFQSQDLRDQTFFVPFGRQILNSVHNFRSNEIKVISSSFTSKYAVAVEPFVY